jgi:hypothetical protein
MKKDICVICDLKGLCIIDDIGGKIDADNKESVCLNCWIKSKLLRFSEDDNFCLARLEREIIDDLETDFKLSIKREKGYYTK